MPTTCSQLLHPGVPVVHSEVPGGPRGGCRSLAEPHKSGGDPAFCSPVSDIKPMHRKPRTVLGKGSGLVSVPAESDPVSTSVDVRLASFVSIS